VPITDNDPGDQWRLRPATASLEPRCPQFPARPPPSPRARRATSPAPRSTVDGPVEPRALQRTWISAPCCAEKGQDLLRLEGRPRGCAGEDRRPRLPGRAHARRTPTSAAPEGRATRAVSPPRLHRPQPQPPPTPPRLRVVPKYLRVSAEPYECGTRLVLRHRCFCNMARI
jgi:hypothetical protein